MGSKMLIDAAHPEETRVVVVRGNKVEDFDYESATRKQLRGNIYLAKVTRVEPSLQAAFVDYGGNRHGFLAFSEIHPDYYQIPVADRQALLEEEAEEESRALAEEAANDENGSSRGKTRKKKTSRKQAASKEKSGNASETGVDPEEAGESGPALEASRPSETLTEAPASRSGEPGDNGNGDSIESVGQEDALEELPARARRRPNYKIQEVIKRRQIILVQVVKEERGNKGAALTTYLSLAGRYTVLMPNTARGGGISRKITNPADRKRLRKIASELEVPKGMGLIIRTAGASRTKSEIKRDFEYLMRMWENIRDLTLKSTAPTLVYEEGNLIKRAIRDLYNKEIDDIEVAGEEAYKEAKSFMRMLMPSHAKNVKLYKDPEPVFVRHQIERQLSAMFSPYVTLRSGGYIVINQTEALVSIDVNSGKATREHNIEDTALHTNLEAAEEISRQLRLRDLAGLIVIDFIDMEERRNNRSVERKLKDCLKNDRARIQVGRISPFGLMEMSRQRLRAGVLEGSTASCPMCQGTGIVRSTESVALDVLRTLEDTLLTETPSDLTATTSVDAALYILNQKRASLKDIEIRYGVSISIGANESLHGANFVIERRTESRQEPGEGEVVQMDSSYHKPSEEADGERRKRRGRRRRREQRPDKDSAVLSAKGSATEELLEAAGERQSGAEPGESETEDHERGARRSRRRGRRGGRRTKSARSGDLAEADQAEITGEPAGKGADDHAELAAAAEEPARETGSQPDRPESERPEESDGKSAKSKSPEKAPKKAPKRTASQKNVATKSAAEPEADAEVSGNGQGEWASGEAGTGKPDKRTAARTAREEEEARSAMLAEPGRSDDDDTERRPPRRGWWQRRPEDGSAAPDHD